jgi:hypothetical protein
MRRLAASILLLLLISAGSGCYESPDLTYHEPGIYKGSKDPLLTKQSSLEYLVQIHKRFRNVQTDR